MAKNAYALLETALRERKLDRTLTTALAPLDLHDSASVAAMDDAGLDASLHGGLPRGQLSELAGSCSSGRTTLVLQWLAAATRRGEIVALVDAFDRLDVSSAASAGVDLARLLWIRGVEMEGAVARALKALNLVLQAGGFGLVVLDLADASPAALRDVPPATWLRVQRIVEGSDTACVLLAPRPMARSAGGLTLSLTARSCWTGASRGRRLTGARVTVQVVSPRRRLDGSITVEAHESHGSHARG